MGTSYRNTVMSYYNKIARKFHTARMEGRKPLNDDVEMPAMMRLINIIYKGQSILDIGCGTGIYSRILASQGATVTAIDLSPAMLAIASDYCQGLNINFRETSFEEFDEEEKYDLIIGSFMLGYFSNLQQSFAKARRLLKTSGAIVISGLHPIRTSAIIRTDETYIVRDYFANNYYYSEIIPGEEKVPLFRHTLHNISDAAWNNKLVIERILEPLPVNTEINSDTALLFHCPSVLALRLSVKGD